VYKLKFDEMFVDYFIADFVLNVSVTEL